jgi:hypothetical protein
MLEVPRSRIERNLKRYRKACFIAGIHLRKRFFMFYGLYTLHGGKMQSTPACLKDRDILF